MDYDRDGKLDLVVANYVQWSQQSDLYCTLDGAHKSYCTPESYKGTSVRLWHNLGNGKFEDATQKAGLGDPTSKSLGIAILDYNGDGWPDILIANDTQPNKLYLNKKDGTFEERGVSAGIAFSEDGVARAGMGVDAADYDRTRPSQRHHQQLLQPDGFALSQRGQRPVRGRSSAIRSRTRHAGHAGLRLLLLRLRQRRLAGHLRRRRPHRGRRSSTYRSASATPNPRIFSTISVAASFRKSRRRWGQPLLRRRVARGAAYADIDNDGDLDVLITTNAGPAYLFHNEGGTNHSLRFKLVGTKSNRDGIGAVVRLSSGEPSTTSSEDAALRIELSFAERTGAYLRAGLANESRCTSKSNGQAGR